MLVRDGRRWVPRAILTALVVLTVATRAPDALREPLWADEVGSARIITARTDDDALSRIRRESSPPGWFYLGRLTHRAGLAPSMEAIRLYSVLFSAALTALVFLYAGRLVPLWSATLAALLVALGYQFVLHGKELRAYALLALASAAFPFVLEAAVAKPRVREAAALAALVAIGTMTHYFFLFVLLGGLLWLWLGRPPGWKRVTVAAGVGCVPLLVWTPVTLFQAGRVNRYFPSFRADWVVELYSNLFASERAWGHMGIVGRLAVLAIVAVGALLLARRVDGRLCAILAVVPVALTTVVWALGLDIFTTRNLIVVGPFAAIAIAAAAAALVPRPLAVAATIALAGVVGWTSSIDRTLGRTPYDDISTALVAMGWTRADPIVLFGRYTQNLSLAWHLPANPRFALAKPDSGDCRALYVVAANPVGHDWLRSHADAVLARERFPFYGSRLEGRLREIDVEAARLGSADALLRDAFARGGLPFRSQGQPVSSCLAPWTPPARAAGPALASRARSRLLSMRVWR